MQNSDPKNDGTNDNTLNINYNNINTINNIIYNSFCYTK